MKRLLPILVFGATVLAWLAVVPAASAQGDCGLSDCTPYEVDHTYVLSVSPPAAGTVTSEGISCPGDCSQPHSWTEICTPMPRQDDCSGDPPAVSLSASRGAGWTASWTGCAADDGSPNTCTVVMDRARTVSVGWVDTGAPGVSFSSPAAKAGPATTYTASASDNQTGVAKVDFYVDDQHALADTSAPYEFKPNLAAYVHGSSHVVKAIATDAAATPNASSLLASAPAHTFTVDRSTGLTNVSTPAAHVQSAPSVTFTTPSDLKPGGVTCRTKRESAVIATTTSCTSGYAAQLGASPIDGVHSVELTVEDDVGNVATVTRSFTLDRGKPNLTVTAPAGGAFLNAAFTPTWTATDGFTAPASIAIACRIDSGPYGSCAGLSAPDGARVLTVRARDLAQNEETRTVAFTYDATKPVVTITGGPANESVVYERSTAFAFTTSDLTALQRTCRLDAAAFGPCTAAGRHELAGLSLGIHTFTLRVVDAAGNVTEVQRQFVVADRDAPPPPGDTGTGGSNTGGTGGSTGGTGGSTGGTGGSTGGTGGPTGGAALFRPTIRSRYSYKGSLTTFGALKVRSVPADARVVVKCRGKGCPVKSRSLRHSGGTVNVLKALKRLRLRAGSVLELHITSASGERKIARWKIRNGKLPLDSYRCAVPGGKLGGCG